MYTRYGGTCATIKAFLLNLLLRTSELSSHAQSTCPSMDQSRRRIRFISVEQCSIVFDYIPKPVSGVSDIGELRHGIVEC